jgi:UDP-2,3-diacylglucosamine pyrophosphatase LpxH
MAGDPACKAALQLKHSLHLHKFLQFILIKIIFTHAKLIDAFQLLSPFESNRCSVRTLKTIYMEKVQSNDLLQEETIIPFDSNGRNIYILSDLHLASGLNTSGNYEGTENFYADQSFHRFLDHLQPKVAGKGGILVINGDFIDFLRIRNIPETEDHFRCWQEILENMGINKSIDELKSSIVKKEAEYGLKTDDYKSVWKLYVCMQGHKILFSRLAQWIYEGNELIIVKGNHDLEWYWPAIHRYLRFALAKKVGEEKGVFNEGLQKHFERSINYIDHAVLIDNKIHVEHGHIYERTTAVIGPTTFNKGKELNLPFGSFFNRYLINRLELAYPYLDNVRPMQNILPVLIRERFPLAIKVLFQYIPFTLLIIPKKLYWQTFKYLLNILFIIVLPIAITVYAIWQSVQPNNPGNAPSGVAAQALNVLKNFGFLFLSYIFGRIMAMAGLKAPPTLSVHAKDIMEKNPSVETVIFGHTHDPEQKYLGDNKWYFNTGTWIPIFETSSADVRLDKTFTFIAANCTGKPTCRERLQRWNDEAERIDTMTLNDKF